MDTNTGDDPCGEGDLTYPWARRLATKLGRRRTATGAAAAQRLSSMSFVDLAGSERAARTGNAGQRMREMVAINSSLMTLGRCMEALRWNQLHPSAEQRLVPYRESKVSDRRNGTPSSHLHGMPYLRDCSPKRHWRASRAVRPCPSTHVSARWPRKDILLRTHSPSVSSRAHFHAPALAAHTATATATDKTPGRIHATATGDSSLPRRAARMGPRAASDQCVRLRRGLRRDGGGAQVRRSGVHHLHRGPFRPARRHALLRLRLRAQRRRCVTARSFPPPRIGHSLPLD